MRRVPAIPLPRPGRAVTTVLASLLALGAVLAPAAPTGAAEPPPAGSVFGADVRAYQVNSLAVDQCPGETASCVEASHLHWGRQEITWSALQPQAPAPGYSSQPATCPSSYCYWDQAYVDRMLAQVKTLTDRGVEPIVIFQWSPAWVNGGAANRNCYVPDEHFGDYAAALGNLVRAFKAAGVPVHYWQVWNEPETTLKDLGAGCGTMGVGGFGDEAAADYGGGRFAKFLGGANAAAKAADAGARILPGGWAMTCPDCPAAKFFDGMLRYDADGNGTPDGINYFDVYDYHAYPEWRGTRPGTRDWSFAGWNKFSSGRGYIFDKLVYVRDLLARYGAADKPIVIGEVGLTCYDNAAGTHPCPDMSTDPGFTGAQANMVVRTYTRAMHYGLLAVEWYSFGDGLFNESELVDTDRQTQKVTGTRPGYQAFKALAAAIGGATYKGELTCRIDPGQELCQPGASPSGPADAPYKGYTFEGYEFCRGTTGVQVLWANDSTLAPASWPLPAGAVVKDLLGRPQEVGGTLPVTFSPSLVELPGAATCAPPTTTAEPTTTTTSTTVAPTTTGPSATTAPPTTGPPPAGGLPFTGAGAAVPLLLGGLALGALGVTGVVTGRHRGRRVARR